MSESNSSDKLAAANTGGKAVVTPSKPAAATEKAASDAIGVEPAKPKQTPPQAETAVAAQPSSEVPPPPIAAAANDKSQPPRQEKEIEMNSVTSLGNLKVLDDGFAKATSLFSAISDVAAKNMEAFKNSVAAGLQGAEQVRTQILATGIKALEIQSTNVATLSAVKSPQEAFALQQQFTRDALEAYTANARALSEVLSSAMAAAIKPLNERATEMAKDAALP